MIIKNISISNRWIILLGGFLLSLMGGMSYSWGSFVIPLVNNWGWTTMQATLPFTIMIIVFALTMIPAGWIQDKVGPKKVAVWGSVLFFIGYALSGMLKWIPNPAWLVFAYGLIVGIACGLTYSCIAPAARKWYPDHPGFAVSASVMGFGLAAIVFSPLKRIMINLWDVNGTLMALSIFVSLVSLIGALIIQNPPDGYTVFTSNISSKKIIKKTAAPVEDIPPKQFIKRKEFYILWTSLAMVIGGGLTAIGLIPAYAEVVLQLSPAVAASAVSAYALTNGFGRPVIGLLSDKYGTMRVMVITYTIQAAVFIALPWVAVNLWLLILCSLLLGIGYATTFALFPVLVASGFGSKYLGINYGLVFSSFGIGALTSLLGSWLHDITGSYSPAFILAGVTTVIGLLLLVILRREKIK